MTAKLSTARLLLAGATLLLAACAELPKAPPAKTVYDFGLPAERFPGSDSSGVVLVVGSPPWMDERDMLYRLRWDDPQLRRSYATSRWAATPSQLLALRWRQRLGLGQPNDGDGGCQLRVRVDEFSQVFSSVDTSEAMLDAAAILVSSRGRVLARHQLVARQSAGADGRSGAAALAQVADVAAEQIRGWLAEPAAAACR